MLTTIKSKDINYLKNSLFICSGIMVLFLISTKNYLLFHCLVEGFSVVIGVLIFITGVVTLRYSKNYMFLFLGCAYFFVAIMDFFHLLTYKGMGVFPLDSVDIPTQLWVAARYVESCSLLCAPFFINKKFSLLKAIFIYVVIVGVLLTSIMWIGIFPTCFAPNRGLTRFKILSEYIICVITMGGIINYSLVVDKRQYPFSMMIMGGMVLTILAECFFSFYVDVYGIMNFLGHVFKFFSFVFIMKAILFFGFEDPYNTIFLELQSRTKALEKNLTDKNKIIYEVISLISKIVEYKEPFTSGHQTNVAILSCQIAEQLGLTPERVNVIKLAALVHDLGKIGIPVEILSYPRPVKIAEKKIIRMHPQIGYDLLKTIEFPWPIADIVLQHHERLDGSGYPKGISGDQITLEARIIAVADVFEAMVSHRPYRPARDFDTAFNEIWSKKGILYDPEVATALKAVIENSFLFCDSKGQGEQGKPAQILKL